MKLGPIPEFEALQVLRRADAAQKVHPASSTMARDTMRQAMEEGRSFVFDGTMSKGEKDLEWIKLARSKGYYVHLVGAAVDPGLAWKRAEERRRLTGRGLPREALEDGHRGFAVSFEQFLPYVDEAVLYDTTNGAYQAKRIYEKRGKTVDVVDRNLNSAFGERKQ